jgi:hypothetical protein
MSVEEELAEHTEHAKAPFDKKVAASMAIIAAGLAVVSVFGQLFANEELLAQAKASDQWSYYQAKSIRRYESDIARDMFKGMSGEVAAKGAEKYQGNIEKYQKEGEEIQVEARKLESESEFLGKKALRMHIGEIFLEMGIVLASLAILSKREAAWYAALASAAVGVAIALSMFSIVH